jgi:hypothetical protein
MRTIAFAIVFVVVHSCIAMAQGDAAKRDQYYSRLVSGISIHDNSRDLPNQYKVRHAFVGSHVSILVKLGSIDRTIFFDQKATRRLLNQISLWVDEQLVMQGVMRPSLTVIRFLDSGYNSRVTAIRDGLSEPWWIIRASELRPWNAEK